MNAEEEKEGPSPYYARIEMYGVFGIDGGPRTPMYVAFVPHLPKGIGYPLDVSKLKGWTVKKWLKLNGRGVHLTGTLEYQVIVVGDNKGQPIREKRLVIVVDRLQAVHERFPEPTLP